MMKTTLLRAIPIASIALMLVISFPSHAEQQLEPGTPSAAQVNDSDIKAFAEATLKIDELNAKWVPELSAAESPEQEQQIREEAGMEMLQAVESAGLEPETFNRIAQAAHADQALTARILEYREELR